MGLRNLRIIEELKNIRIQVIKYMFVRYLLHEILKITMKNKYFNIKFILLIIIIKSIRN